MLLYGRASSGVTCVCERVCAMAYDQYSYASVYVDCRKFKGTVVIFVLEVLIFICRLGKKVDNIISRLSSHINDCNARSPSILVLDNLDTLIVKPTDQGAAPATQLNLDKLMQGNHDCCAVQQKYLFIVRHSVKTGCKRSNKIIMHNTFTAESSTRSMCSTVKKCIKNDCTEICGI